MKQQSGFTLIELIMVIVILGILAAVALPKFANLRGAAVVASVNGLRGSVNSAAVIAHSQWLIAPATAAIEGVPVTYVNGYPDTLTIGPLAGVANATDYTTIPASSAATANTPITTATQAAFIPAAAVGTTAGLTCFVMYTQAAAGGAPTVTATTGGC